jgi:PhzF family phenazine biosynthesis protein
MTYRLYHVDVFTTQPYLGNPATVVPNADGLGDSQMQAIARELRNSETAFVFSATGSDHDVMVRFFTPTCEVPSCGHATIAAIYVISLERQLPSCIMRMKCNAGILDVAITRRSGSYSIRMTQGRPQFRPIRNKAVVDEIVGALGLDVADLDRECPIEVVSTGHAKVLVGVVDHETLNKLRPNYEQVIAAAQSVGVPGFFVFTRHTDVTGMLTECRMFAPAIGIPEDPVTGNGNGPLGAYLVRHKLVLAPSRGTFSFNSVQGRKIGRQGVVRVAVKVNDGEPKTVSVGDDAVLVYQATLVNI